MTEKIELDPIKVLDKGYVKLIDYMGTDETIIEAARMSTGKGFQGWDKDEALLEYLYSNDHATPFEMCEIHLEVQAPIFVFRQWHRHRTQSYNEFSGRYSELPDMFYVPTLERCMDKQGVKNRQGSSPSNIESEPQLVNAALQKQKSLREEQEGAYGVYKYRMYAHKLPKELARINIPVSVYSKMRAKANLRNWLHFLNLRMDAHAQEEIRVYGEAVGSIIKRLFPRTYFLFEEYTLHSVRFSRSEMEVLRQYMNISEPNFPEYLRPIAFITEKKKKGLIDRLCP